MFHINNQENKEIIKIKYSYIFGFILIEKQNQTKPCLCICLYPCKTCIISVQSSTPQISLNIFGAINSQTGSMCHMLHSIYLKAKSCHNLGLTKGRKYFTKNAYEHKVIYMPTLNYFTHQHKSDYNPSYIQFNLLIPNNKDNH